MYFHKKHKNIEYTDGLWRDLFSFQISFLSALLFSAIAFCCFPRISFWSGIWLGLSVNVIVTFLRPACFLDFAAKEVRFPKKKVVVSSILLAGLLFETFFASSRCYSLSEPTRDYTSLATSSSISGLYQTNQDGTIRVQSDSYVVIPCDQNFHPENIQIRYKDGSGATITVSLEYADINNNYHPLGSYKMDDRNTNFSIIPVSVSDALSYRLKFQFVTNFYDSPTYADIEALSFNVPLEFHFSILRSSLFAFFVLFFAHLSEIGQRKTEKEPGRMPYLLIAGLTAATVVGLGISIAASPGDMARTYPIPPEELYAMTSTHTGATDIFVSLFDAFAKGRIDLDLPVDPGLLELENPYIPGARYSMEYYWDHAFYQGKYYSYYGPAPVILVSFPFYLLSGCRYVLTAFGLEVLGMPLFIGSFLFLLLEIMRMGKKKFSYAQYLVFAVFGLLTAMTISLFTWKDGAYHEAVYHVPDIYGLAAFSMFFAFCLRAYRSEKLRSLQLALSGFFFVVVVFARPNLFVALLIAIPFFLSMLFQKQTPIRKKLIWFGPMMGILAVGGAVACIYNYARFQSIFEFGQSYQFTVADQTNLTYSTQKILPTFFHFFLQGGVFYNQFPYLSCSLIRYSFETKELAPYVQSYFGMLAVPFFWTSVLLPFILQGRKENAMKWMGYLFPATLFAFAFTTYSKAGVCPRYLSELYYLATIGSVFGFLEMERITRDTKIAPYAIGVGVGLFALSAFMCLNLSFDSFDGMKEGSCGGLLLRFREAFGSLHFV
ncbi:MAG: hypothetical protein SOV58_05295 [Candidatus Enteromonas sp.]|nr:hypothetical protein [Candidatus Enteromonas sp.]